MTRDGANAAVADDKLPWQLDTDVNDVASDDKQEL